MQTAEINGFAIDKLNQHGLEEGNKQGMCPLCSHTRKPKNQKKLISGTGVRGTTGGY